MKMETEPKGSPSRSNSITHTQNSLNVSNANSNNFNFNRLMKSPSNSNKPYLEAIEYYKKLCLKTYTTQNSNFVNTLKNESLNLFLESYNLKEINIINKIIGSYYYFKQIVLAPFDVNKSNQVGQREKFSKTATPLTPSEKVKEEKDKREKEVEKRAKIYSIVQGIAKNLYMTENVHCLKILNLDLKQELTEFLSEGIVSNKTIKNLTVNNCTLTNEAYEILLKGVLTHEAIEFLDLSYNNLDDKCGNMIGRIISRQTQRRDQVIWMYGLRNEKPLNNDYTKGLISINLAYNQLSDISADNISNAISYDSYIRSIALNNNEFSSEGCKKFIKILRRNQTILNLDLRNNPGYDNGSKNIHKRLVVKLAKNIKHLHKQYLEDVYSKQEYDYLKKFVNYEYFNVDIPQHIIEMYNQKLEEENLERGREGSVSVDSSNKFRVHSASLDERRKKAKEKKQNKDLKESTKSVNKDSLNIRSSHEKENGILNSIEEDYVLDAEKIKTQNKDLFHENLQLRKQMLALRAQILQNQTGGGKAFSITSNSAQINNVDDINNPITQNLTQQHVNLSLTGTNNNINISSNPRIAPMTGEEGSYEVYYNRVENLLSELTRLMDNMENNFRRNES